jgi:hypothetical protein
MRGKSVVTAAASDVRGAGSPPGPRSLRSLRMSASQHHGPPPHLGAPSRTFFARPPTPGATRRNRKLQGARWKVDPGCKDNANLNFINLPRENSPYWPNQRRRKIAEFRLWQVAYRALGSCSSQAPVISGASVRDPGMSVSPEGNVKKARRFPTNPRNKSAPMELARRLTPLRLPKWVPIEAGLPHGLRCRELK